MMMINRRRVMGGSKPDYIKDGLVLWLDGIDKGGNSGYWTDLVGGIKFEFNAHSDIKSDCVEFDGAGLIFSDRNINVSKDIGTIEVVYSERKNNAVVYFSSGENALCFCLASAGITFYTRGEKNQWSCSHQDTATVSCNKERIIRNGIILTSSLITNLWIQNRNSASVGGRRDATPYYYKGKINSIRLYNRLLTPDEILYNQQIDNIRFNLGLNI